ncbi:MAG: extracellular solute-binding protein family 1 [Clostridia bacterium]|nr:extracellular solute-binding protein family 1 [Clostridia bacterium]
MIKRITAFLLLILIFFTLQSCGSADKPAENNNEEEIVATDMDGYEFIFGVTAHLDNTPELLQPVGFSDRGDKILTRYNETGTHFNCNMNVFLGTDMATAITTAAATGDRYASLVESFRLPKEYLRPFTDYEDFDLSSDKWGSPNMLKVFSYGKDVYGVYAGYWGLPYPWMQGTMFYAPPRIKEAGLTDPHELYEQKKWSWNDFEEYCRSYTQISTIKEESKYGFVVTPQVQFIRAAILSNGGSYLTIDENGKLLYGLDSPESIEAIDWVKNLINDEQVGTYISDSYKLANRGIMNGTYAFHVDASILSFYDGEAHYAMEFEEPHGWIQFPVGPKGNYDIQTTGFSAAKFLFMPLENNDSNIEYDNEIINYIFEPLENETSDTWKTDMRRNFFFEDASFNYFIDAFENSLPSEYYYMTPKSYNFEGIIGNILNSKKTPTEMLQSQHDKIMTEVDEINAQLVD